MNDERFDADWQREAERAERLAKEHTNSIRVGYAVCRARTLIMHRTPEEVEALFRRTEERAS